MVESAYSNLRRSGYGSFMVPAEKSAWKGDGYDYRTPQGCYVPVILVVNKIDKVRPDQLLAQIDDFRSQVDFSWARNRADFSPPRK